MEHSTVAAIASCTHTQVLIAFRSDNVKESAQRHIRRKLHVSD